ncbi:MAG: MgtC/SapB family protein [Defluviitaleaceae bacterium]|nr:MgtC/SapB family protein [Defluviitaleaceae bacterium]
MEFFDFVIRVFFAVLFGFLIGLERQLTSHKISIRTNVLVSIGACLFTLFSIIMGAEDTTRIAAQVVTGIGFLCGGVIFKEGLNVSGLSTAATIWCTAAIGVLTSSGLIHYAAAATAILIVSNIIFRLIADKIHPLSNFGEEENEYILSVTCCEDDEFNVRSVIIESLSKARLRLSHLESADEIGNKVEIEATVTVYGKRRDVLLERLMAQIALEKGVSKVGWEMLQ